MYNILCMLSGKVRRTFTSPPPLLELEICNFFFFTLAGYGMVVGKNKGLNSLTLAFKLQQTSGTPLSWKNVQMKHFDTKLKYYTHTKSCSKFKKNNNEKKDLKKKSIKNK